MTGSADQIRATTYQFATPNPLDVSIRNQAGSVEITAADVSETTVEIVPNDAKGAELAGRTLVALSEDAGQLRIDVPDRKMLRQPPLEIIVTLPTGSTVDVETATADVRMRGIFDGVHVNTASADVSVPHVTGRAEVNSASGDVHLSRCEGPVQVRTASGDVRLDYSGVQASVQTASGDALLGRISGDLAVRSASGDVIVATAGAGSLQAKTMSGDVVVGVAPGLLLWLDVHSLSGDVASQLGPDDSVDGDDADPETLREPDLRISASTMSGDVILRRGR
ncbi:MAG: DUF4097 domain-containing protein [Actinomycetota bacterium]|nr:DUF4097 domain-containing protein [Actinomycetota bacterium]